METVEVTITSGKDLKNVNWRHGKLKPYAVVWVDPSNKRSTAVDDEGDTSPSWNHKLLIPFSSSVPDSTLHIDIVHADAAEDTKPLVGSAKLPLRDVLDEAGRLERTLQLKRPSGRPQGKLEITVCIPDRRYRAPDPYYAPAYGAVSRPESRDYPAPQSDYPPYGAPPSGYPAYGAPPAGYPAYGAPPSGSYYVGEEKKSKFGGMGTGLAVGAVAGVLGGLALAEGVDALEDHIADDAAERVEDDLGYDGDDY